MWPNIYNEQEGNTLMGCFKARRHDAVAAVDALCHLARENRAISPALAQRLRNGGAAWFAVSPHNKLRPYEPSIGWRWVPLDPHSMAMRETLDWLTLCLCLGWEIPLRSLVPGVWFEPREWEGILSLAGMMIAEGNVAWAQFPYGIRRTIA